MPNWIQHCFEPVDRIAAWPDRHAYRHAARAWMIDQTLNSVDLADVQRVVDVGCGDGWICHHLAQRFPHVVGFDINPRRIEEHSAQNVLLVAGTAEDPPIADGWADLVFSFAVLEHLPERVATLRSLRRLLSPTGRMIHVVPTTWWKTLQWMLFVPNKMRKQCRSLTRALAGRPKQRRGKFYEGHETNNPYRVSRRAWYQRLYPRVHGEFDSNWEEFRQWTPGHWASLFGEADMRVVEAVELGIESPYCFGLSLAARRVLGRRFPCHVAFVAEPLSQQQRQAPKRPHMLDIEHDTASSKTDA
jgi:SAM-dependent methyltransferase